MVFSFKIVFNVFDSFWIRLVQFGEMSKVIFIHDSLAVSEVCNVCLPNHALRDCKNGVALVLVVVSKL